jgi:ubiquinone/menaquinone biosynthesis C-methylase UbiE
MKTRESGMPSEDVWDRFFDPKSALSSLGLTHEHSCVVDFGCGYGTFSIPAANLIQGKVYAIDIDPEMVASTQEKSIRHGLSNIQVIQRDFIEFGSGLPAEAADYVMLFNILHAVEAASLLTETRRVLRAGGRLGVIHWNYDPSTLRGPSMEIRLKPEQSIAMVKRAGFAVSSPIELPPYHYGFVAERGSPE